MSNIKIELPALGNLFVDEKGCFKKEDAIKLGGMIAGVCYDKEGFNHIVGEPEEKTNRRIDLTLGNGHHSVYDHISIMMNLQNIPKILAMVLNNEHQYTTSEKSARYTPVVRTDDSPISQDEEILYNKWIDLFKMKIKHSYGDVYNDSKIQKLAQENARYLVTVFMPTTMIHTTTFRQINYLASYMQRYIDEADMSDAFEYQLANAMKEFINELDRLNILEERLMRNEKHGSLSLFNKKLNMNEEFFGNVYETSAEVSFAELAQAQRHRTLYYTMEMMKDKQFYVPRIIRNDQAMVDEWLNDMNKIKDVTPQGELVKVYEMGLYDKFILKCKERLCSAAQLEIMEQTRDTLLQYKNELENNGSNLAEDIESYTHGARCTFPDYECPQSCGFNEGITLSRKI